MSLDFCCDIQMVGSEFGVKNMKASIQLAHFVPIEHSLNATAYLSIVADHVHPFMTTVYPSSDGYFQQDNAPCHKAQIISDWFLEHDNEFTLLKWPPQSPDLNPIEHIWDLVEREICIMDVQLTNLQQLRDAIMSIWTKISEQCFQHLGNMCWKKHNQDGAEDGSRVASSGKTLQFFVCFICFFVVLRVRCC